MKLFYRQRDSLIDGLRRADRTAQRRFYDENSARYLSVCRAYVADTYHAEDCLIKAFCKVFNHIKSYSGSGSFDGWVRRIVVNECLNFLKSQCTILYFDENLHGREIKDDNDIETGHDFDAQNLLDQLPEAYRLVFNLYVLEDYSHAEISEMLNISLSASKTQLFRAKQRLKEIYLNQKTEKNESL